MRAYGLWTSFAASIVAVIAACSSGSSDSSLDARRAAASSGSSSGGDGGAGTDPNDPNRLPVEQQKFQAVLPDLLKNCGNSCHDTGKYTQPAPTFLAAPDPYKSIKSHPGIVVRDVYTSILLTKGTHAGPAVSSLPDFEQKIQDWLEAEAVVIQSQKLPSTAPFTVATGANDVDLTPASSTGLSGVHLTFDAALVGTSLALSKLTLVVPAGQDVHVLQPRFVRVLAQADDTGRSEIPDPADSFSNADQTVPQGKSTLLLPGEVLFGNATWVPFDLASDKLRIEFVKLEPGKVSVVAPAATCKDVQGFATNVLPNIRNQQVTNGTCGGCHGNGLGGMNLASTDNGFICQQILGKLNQADIGTSLIVTKVSGGMAHQGGQVADPNAWKQLFVTNAGVFF
jgi:hypothetical protein